MGIDHEKFGRMLGRSAEIAGEAGADPRIARVYAETLAEPAQKYQEKQRLLARAEGAWAKESGEARGAIERLDRPYGAARAVVLAYHPHLSLPDPLKSQPTDTDRVDAIESLLGTVDELGQEGWAADVLGGEFGQQAPEAIREVNEAIAANKALAAARDARAEAYGLAYERYLAFKRVVRHVCGRTSPQYRRVHLRAAGASGEGGTSPAGGGPTPPAGGGPGGPAPA